ncbi:uncharacterized protein LOC113299604 [Papaver somniferum]|uniref:uncharacterized protein LOC113299604 n=1 Tax=Papaver somniferum TaxID=3469 RepID=UPI000E701E73|nr:uncharacterized protein LOC113299604 [Papaver somniferum]
MSRLRGQGYDGESNCRGELHGLKSLILKENECAYYIHCFANKLQSILVSVGTEQFEVYNLFKSVAKLVDIVGAVAKRYANLQERDVVLAFEELKNSGFLYEMKIKAFAFVGDSNLETTLIWSSVACEDSHYNTLSSLITMFASVIDVLDVIERDGYSGDDKFSASGVLDTIFSFPIVFSLHLMKTILGITSDLSKALQRRDQDLVNAMKLVKVCKEQLQMMRDNGWDSLFKEVCSFCDEHQMETPNMDNVVPRQVRYRRSDETQEITNMHYYHVELFQGVLNMILQELNNRFTETDTELLLCIVCLSPSDSFSAFNKQQLIRLAQFYPVDFSAAEIMTLADQLESYISDVRSDVRFSELNGIADLAQKMVETDKDKVYNLVYLLLTLALILPVATAKEQRVFSSINRGKVRVDTGLEDEWMSDRLIPYIESDILNSLDNETIVRRVENLKLSKRDIVALN